MSLQYNVSHRNADVTDILTQLGSTGFLAIFSGAPPANCASAPTGTLLVSLPCSNPAGSVSAGVLTFGAIAQTNAVANGSGGYFRLFPSSVTTGTNAIAQGTVGVSGSDLNFSGGTTFTTGSPVNISGATITAAGA